MGPKWEGERGGVGGGGVKTRMLQTIQTNKIDIEKFLLEQMHKDRHKECQEIHALTYLR